MYNNRISFNFGLEPTKMEKRPQNCAWLPQALGVFQKIRVLRGSPACAGPCALKGYLYE